MDGALEPILPRITAPIDTPLIDAYERHFGDPKRQRAAKRLEDADARAAQAARIDEIRQQGRPLELSELETAKNKAVRLMIRNLPDMRVQELMAAREVLEAEIASLKVGPQEAAKPDEFTREKALAALQGRT